MAGSEHAISDPSPFSKAGVQLSKLEIRIANRRIANRKKFGK